MLQPDAGSPDSSSKQQQQQQQQCSEVCGILHAMRPCCCEYTRSMCLEAIWQWKLAVLLLVARYFLYPTCSCKMLRQQQQQQQQQFGYAAKTITCIRKQSITNALQHSMHTSSQRLQQLAAAAAAAGAAATAGRGKTFLCNKLKCYLNW
jgi:hypothetical protein